MNIRKNVSQWMRRRLVRAANLLAQDEGAQKSAEKIITPGMPALLRDAAAEGAVLLENHILPFPTGASVAVFGRTQVDYFCTGYGSGGDVNTPYKVSLLEGIRNCERLQANEKLAALYTDWCEKNPVDHGEWGQWPRYYPEMPLDAQQIMQTAEESEYALLVLGRAAGEDRENALEPGSYYLTEDEKNLLKSVSSVFGQRLVVLMNIGSIMDFSWTEALEKPLGALMIVWQGGMESGNAVADLLSGKKNPSGRLTDTIAKSYENYISAPHFGGEAFNNYVEDIYVGYRWFETFAREDVRYPFGYGLSYTHFSMENKSVEEKKEGSIFHVTVTNTGKVPGRETVCLYLEKPCTKGGNPSRELAAFAKTRLLNPKESQTLIMEIPRYSMASYDGDGSSGHKSCYVIEAGTYAVYLGGDVRSARKIYEQSFKTLEILCSLSEVCAPQVPFSIIKAQETEEGRRPVQVPVATRTTNLREIILRNLPAEILPVADQGYTLRDVKDGRVSMETFVAQLTLKELEAISRGDYIMGSPLGTRGNAGVFGGVLPSLRKKGIPPVTTTDGPSGIRLYASASLLPIGTLLACSFDVDLVRRLYRHVGMEMLDRGSDLLLAPGMNIHRNPLCGRNFEYFSEDPLLTGKMGAAVVQGLQSTGVSACPKHFACNNQEFKRNKNDSRVSERALREIYLKGFEICVKEGKPQNIMTAYNKINGVWGHYHYELCTSILRQEWEYQGSVMTDWWMQSSHSPEFPQMRDNAYRVRAQVDVLMPGNRMFHANKPDGTLLETYGKPEGITLGEMQRTAANVLRFVMASVPFQKGDGEKEEAGR